MLLRGPKLDEVHENRRPQRQHVPLLLVRRARRVSVRSSPGGFLRPSPGRRRGPRDFRGRGVRLQVRRLPGPSAVRGPARTSEVITPRPITPTFGYRDAPTQCRFVASGCVVETSLGGVSWGRLVGGGLWTSILFEYFVSGAWSGWTSPGSDRVSVDVSRGGSGLFSHCVGGMHVVWPNVGVKLLEL